MPMGQVTFADIVREHRRSYPDGVDLVDGDHRFTWPELDDRTNQLADALAAAGLGEGDRVLWMAQTSFRLFELLVAVAKLGAMVCPVNWRQSPAEMAFVLEDFDPKVVVWQEAEIGESVRAARGLADTKALWLRHDAENGGDGSY